jgi:16S rRNA (adenine1518-N6/adenine1519-N6)-dimethyltransferase
MLEWELQPKEMCLMLQKEVADRITARPGNAAYGTLSVLVDYWGTAEALFTVPAGAFWPRPKVSSRVLRIRRRRRPAGDGRETLFADTVRELFARRRKTVSRALREAWGRDFERKALKGVPINPRSRPEVLATADFEAISRLRTRHGSSDGSR